MIASGPIPISEPLRHLLAVLRALAATVLDRRAELNADPTPVKLRQLEAIENQIGIELPYDILAIAALRMPILSAASGIDLDGFVASHDDVGSTRWVPIATAEYGTMHPEYEFSPTDQGVHSLTLCIEKKAPREGEPKVRVVDEEEPDRTKSEPLTHYLGRRLAQRYPDDWDAAIKRAAEKSLAAFPWTVEIVDDRPPPLEIAVTHPKFGPGTIVKLMEGDKVEVRFASGETKTLLRKFLVG